MCSINLGLLSLDNVVRMLMSVGALSIVYLFATAFRNLLLHPLSKFPGPKLWAASHLPNFYHIFRGSRVYRISELHEKFGPVVRVSPSELSYIDESAWRDIYGAHKDGQLRRDLVPGPKVQVVSDLFSQPDDQRHGRMRKKLSPAFSDKSLREREGILQKFSDLLMSRLKDTQGKAEDVLSWFDCATTDITGELVFGESFHSLETGELHPIIESQNELLTKRPIGWIWYKDPVLRFLRRFRSTKPPHFAIVFRNTVVEKLNARKARHANGKADGEIPDIMAVLSTDVGSAKGLSGEECSAIGVDLLVAGSDTVANALSAATYFLAQNPTKMTMLKREIGAAFKTPEDITLASVSPLKYQNAVLSEAMRLMPPAGESLRRVTGPNGCVIRGEFVPPGISVGVYHWAAGHSSWCWKDVESFVPERWLDDENYRDDKRAVFQVFNTGPKNCVGQNLAWAEMRLILAKLVFHFDVELCDASEDWTDMPVYGLAYVKRPLMVRVQPAK